MKTCENRSKPARIGENLRDSAKNCDASQTIGFPIVGFPISSLLERCKARPIVITVHLGALLAVIIHPRCFANLGRSGSLAEELRSGTFGTVASGCPEYRVACERFNNCLRRRLIRFKKRQLAKISEN